MGSCSGQVIFICLEGTLRGLIMERYWFPLRSCFDCESFVLIICSRGVSVLKYLKRYLECSLLAVHDKYEIVAFPFLGQIRQSWEDAR